MSICLVPHLQNTRSSGPLRGNDEDELADPASDDDERYISGGRLDDAAQKFQHAEVKVPKGLNTAALAKADDFAAKIESVVAKYPEGLSKSALQQLVKVEEQRVVDLKAGKVLSKATGDGLRRDAKLLPGMKSAPVSTSHVGRGAQRYEDGNRLLACVVVSRPAKQGGGDVLLISRSKPEKRDWLLPKGGWDHGEKARVAARRELLEEGGVAGIKPKMLPKLEFKNKDGEGHVYYPFKMTAKTVYDQWPESMRYRIWVSYDDAIKLLANRKEMVELVNAARAVRN